MRRFGRIPRLCLTALVAPLMAASGVLAAGEHATVLPEGWVAVEPEVLVRGCDETGIDVHVSVGAVQVTPRRTDAGSFLEITWPNAAYTYQFGAPALPVARRLFTAPDGAIVRVDVRTGKSIMIDLDAAGYMDPVMPRQAPISKAPGALERAVFEYDKTAYAAGPWPSQRAVVTELGIMRGQRVFQLDVHPLAYDAARGAMTLWPELEIAIDFIGGRANARDLQPLPALNNSVLNPRPMALDGPTTGNYLIMVASEYEAQIGPFAAAKQAAGFNVTVHAVAPGATKEAIKSDIETYWNSANPPDYVLLVGDTDTIPAWTGGGSSSAATDLPYACMDPGGDWYPEFAIGRFSAWNTSQMQSLIDKTLFMDAGIFPDPEYPQRAAFLATNDMGSSGEETHDWVVENIMAPAMYDCIKIYANSGGGTPEVLNAVNNGVAFCYYFGHSSSTGWWNPGLASGDISGLTNTGLYTFASSQSCNVGKYTESSCFGEVFVRAVQKGAFVFLGASYYIYWTSPPWHESSNTEKFLFDSIVNDEIIQPSPAWQATMVKLIAHYGASDPCCRDYSEMFNVLGDPAVIIPMHTPTFNFDADPEAVSICSPAEATYNINVTNTLGYSEPVTFTTEGAPAGATVSFSVNPVTPPGSTVLTVGDTAAAAPGEYTIQIIGTSPDMQHTRTVQLSIAHELPSVVSLLSPPDGEVNSSLTPAFEWTAAAHAEAYELEVATDPGFANIHYTATSDEPSHSAVLPMVPLTDHYWRVRGVNGCGGGDWSEVFTFTPGVGPSILLVDDDDNGPDVRPTYMELLDTLGMWYDIWDTNNSDDEPTLQDLAQYEVVVWFTGVEFGGACGPGAAGEAALSAWLDNGGCLFISAQDYYYDRGLTTLMQNYLGVSSAQNDVGQNNVTGEGSVFGGLGAFSLSYPFSNWSDVIQPAAAAELAFDGNQGDAAVNKDGGIYRTAFLGFPLEAVATAEERRQIMGAFFDYCGGLAPDCPADVNGDLSVNVSDLLAVLAAWGNTGGPEDINGDGLVDVVDLLVLLSAWGPC